VRLYTWILPDAQTKNQIDFIAISQKWKTSIRKCKTYPGADCDTGHVLLVAMAQLRFSKQEKFPTVKRLNVEELVDDKALQYELEIKNRFEALKCIEEETTPNAMWEATKDILATIAEDVVGYCKPKQKKPWITDQTYSLIEDKRQARHSNPSKY